MKVSYPTVLSPTIKLFIVMVPGSVMDTTRPLATSSIGFLESSMVVMTKDPDSMIWLGFSMPVRVIFMVLVKSAATPTRSNRPEYITLSVRGVSTVNPVFVCP
jgi:hypothetical protein